MSAPSIQILEGSCGVRVQVEHHGLVRLFDLEPNESLVIRVECRKTVDVNSLGGVARMVFVQHAGTPGHSGP